MKFDPVILCNVANKIMGKNSRDDILIISTPLQNYAKYFAKSNCESYF